MAGSFSEALEIDDVSAIKSFPKADLHCHAYFATRIENVETWVGKTLPRPPKKMQGLKGMLDYSADNLDGHINSFEGFEFTAEAAVKDAIKDGVTLFEMSIDVRSSHYFSDGVPGLVRHIRGLRGRFHDQIDLRPELGFPREAANDPDLETRARQMIETGIFTSIDLYGMEDACSPDTVETIYAAGRSAGMKLKAHAGEFGDAEVVRKTVEVLGLDEVQHGIGAAESTEVMQWLCERKVRLNICPTSNVMLDNVSTLSEHPIRVLYDHGIPVTVNTDDPMIFGQSVSDEFRNLHRARLFNGPELDGIRLNSLDRSADDPRN